MRGTNYMWIKKLKVNNYRNLDGLEIDFNEKSNFIVGENNTGKSNICELLHVIFNKSSFADTDFTNYLKPIIIEVQLALSDNEIGYFGDLTDVDSVNTLTVMLTQEDIDSAIECIHKSTNSKISSQRFRSINLIRYKSDKDIMRELTIGNNSGVGRFFVSLIDEYLKKENINIDHLFHGEEVDNILSHLNGTLSKLKFMKDLELSANVNSDELSFFRKLIVLTDEKNNKLDEMGSGIKSLSMIPLSLLERLLDVKTKRKRSYILNDDDDKSFLPIIFIADEPELHLHPHKQRALVKNMQDILNNNDQGFSTIMKELFEIDYIVGQSIVVTHSTDIISEDYKEIIRVIEGNEGSVMAYCGSNLMLSQSERKNMLANMYSVREAFFSRVSFIVEGETEQGGIRSFAKKFDVDFDELGVSLIKASGYRTILPLTNLLNKFGINTVSLYDGKEGRYLEEKSSLPDNSFLSEFVDIEHDIVNKVIDQGNDIALKDILYEYDSHKGERILQKSAINKRIKSYNLNLDELNDDQKFSEIDYSNKELVKAMYLTWLGINKSFILGNRLAESLTAEDTPDFIRDAVLKSKELA